MKYYEVKFSIGATAELMQDARDLLAAVAGEAGFETFEDTPAGLVGYVQQQLFNRPVLDHALESFPLPCCTISYEVDEAEDCDWNAQWEEQGFDPIIVSCNGASGLDHAPVIVIHDGRHLYDTGLPGALAVEINARLAFGTGTHETTRMMVAQLLEIDLKGRHVLDCGTGTGILSIAALMLGASQATGYDIDEWSTENARHNAAINGVSSQFTALLGDASVIDTLPTASFHVVMANINRNILLADMPRFCQALAPGGMLIVSGFYSHDVPLLQARARQLGLVSASKRSDGPWSCLLFTSDAR